MSNHTIKGASSSDEVNKEVKKMIGFILQEASEKANEIITRADEEYNMEKAKIYKSEKKLLEEHYNLKRKQAHLKTKMYLH